MKRKTTTTSVDSGFYEQIEKERKKFMKKHNLNKLSTRAFTKVLADKTAFKWKKR